MAWIVGYVWALLYNLFAKVFGGELLLGVARMEEKSMAERGPIEAHTLFQKAFNTGDLQGLLALYEPDAVLIPQPGAEPVKGIQAIRSALEGFLASKGKVELETKHVIQRGDIALLRAAWRIKGTGPDGKPVEMSHGSAEVVRRQPDGSWRYVIDHPFGSD